MSPRPAITVDNGSSSTSDPAGGSGGGSGGSAFGRRLRTPGRFIRFLRKRQPSPKQKSPQVPAKLAWMKAQQQALEEATRCGSSSPSASGLTAAVGHAFMTPSHQSCGRQLIGSRPSSSRSLHLHRSGVGHGSGSALGSDAAADREALAAELMEFAQQVRRAALEQRASQQRLAVDAEAEARKMWRVGEPETPAFLLDARLRTQGGASADEFAELDALRVSRAMSGEADSRYIDADLSALFALRRAGLGAASPRHWRGGSGNASPSSTSPSPRPYSPRAANLGWASRAELLEMGQAAKGMLEEDWRNAARRAEARNGDGGGGGGGGGGVISGGISGGISGVISGGIGSEGGSGAAEDDGAAIAGGDLQSAAATAASGRGSDDGEAEAGVADDGSSPVGDASTATRGDARVACAANCADSVAASSASAPADSDPTAAVQIDAEIGDPEPGSSVQMATAQPTASSSVAASAGGGLTGSPKSKVRAVEEENELVSYADSIHLSNSEAGSAALASAAVAAARTRGAPPPLRTRPRCRFRLVTCHAAQGQA